MTKVAVLGCGPTGLVAAHAAIRSGADVMIYSKRRKSDMFGAQYLHQPIPDTPTGRPIWLRYSLNGTIEDYRRKVYGEDSNVQVSPEDYDGQHAAFDIRAAYDWLWDEYEELVEDTTVSPGWIVGSLPAGFDHVISTVPLPQLCVRNHSFAGQDIWAMGDSNRQTVPVNVAKNTVLCNGEPEPSWYRASNIFDYKTVEWPDNGRKPPLPVAKLTKPLFNTCTCWPQLVRLGRFGMWQKGMLVHHAYMMTMDLMNGDFSAEETRPHFYPCPLADESLTANVARQLGCRCG